MDDTVGRAELAKHGIVTGVALGHGLSVRQVVAAVSRFVINVQAEYWRKQQGP